MIALALSKGKLLEQSLEILSLAGFPLPARPRRNLSIVLPGQSMKIVITKDYDTPLYVELGVADLGICGRDILLERKEPGVYEIADLAFGECQVVVACPRKFQDYDRSSTIRIATKYPRIASEFFISRNVPFELIKISGAAELACASGLADLVVDLVETGQTLEENGLKILEVICSSSARLIVNNASHAMKLKRIEEIKRKLTDAAFRKKNRCLSLSDPL